MSLELEILEKIERYTRGRLTEAEASAFEVEMELDPQLKKRVLASSIVDEIIVSHEALKLKEIMQKDMYKPSFKWQAYLSVALIVVALGGIVYYVASTEKGAQPVAFEAKPSPLQGKIKTSEKEPASLPTQKQSSTVTEKRGVEKAVGETKVASLPEIEQNIVTQEKRVHTVAQPLSLPSYEREIVQRQAVKNTEAVASPCKNAPVEVDFYTVPSCAEKETGELHIRPESVKGGTPPFTYFLEGRSAGSDFDRLSSGTYRLLVKDAKGCTFESSKEVVVSTKVCKEKKEYAYNPEFDPSWVIPYDVQKEPKSFRVMDKGGKSFYQTAVAGNHPEEWKGESSQGLHLGAGLYFFYIEYADGTVDEGSIMVTR